MNFNSMIVENIKFSRFYIIILGVFINVFATEAQSVHKFLRKGDGAYKEGDYKGAEENYRKSLEMQPNAKGSFNLGNAIFKQQRYTDAIKQYDEIIAKSNDNTLKANSLYNKGNAHFWNKEYDKSVEAFKQSLRLNPNDENAKKNLAKAKRQLQEQQKQQQKNQQNQQKDKKGNKDKEDKNQQQPQEPQQDQKQQQQPQDANGQPQQNPQQKASQDLKKEDAKRMLQIMDDEERKVQQRLKKGKPQPSRSTKDW
jgi:Ca-activated chloride channel homolog